MKARSFLDFTRPPLTVLIEKETPQEVLETIEKSRAAGADAFCFLINNMKDCYRTESIFKEIFHAMGDLPAYIANYTSGTNAEKTDEYCLDQAMLALECGASLFDLPGDSFCKSPDEITYDETAVYKQKEIIQQVHAMGKDVLISSHTKRYLEPEEVLKIAFAQKQRGADISKIVTSADTTHELLENCKISILLKQQLNIPHLFLCNGEQCKNHRLINPILGSCLCLCLLEPNPHRSQPSLETMQQFLAHVQ